MVRSYLCDNSSNPVWLTAACNMGTVGMLLRWISPDLVAKQVNYHRILGCVAIINKKENHGHEE